MKRWFVRLSALSVVLVLGLIAIAQAQRAFEKPAKAALKSTQPAKSAKPIPISAEDAALPASDPFAAAQPNQAKKPAIRERQPVAKRQATEEFPTADELTEEAAAELGEPRQFPSVDARPLEDENVGAAADPFHAPRNLLPVHDDASAETLAAAEESTDEAGGAIETEAGAPRRLAPRHYEEESTELTEIPPQRKALSADAGLDASAGAFDPPAGAAQQTGSGTGRPGAQQLEGPQTPTLTIAKSAPAEIQVGKPATFTIKVRNTGTIAAQGVEVHDEVPQGTEFVSSKPAAKQAATGGLVWQLGSVKPGEESVITLQLMPLTEGEIGSVATVHFKAEASVRTRATKPQLAIQVSAPKQVMIGDDLMMKIKITNPGTGAATGVVLSEQVPENMKHPAGGELELEIGELKPGQSRELDLSLTAATAGQVVNMLTARGDANLVAETKVEFEVVAPGLTVAMTGPKKRYLERAATYNISVSNPGTAPAKDIELVTVLPKGLKFVEANNAGHYDAATHSVYWSLEQLPPQETGSVTLKALPVEPGELKLQIKGQAKQGLVDEKDEIITVEGLAAIQFAVVDVSDPVEVGGECAYQIKVTNQGSKAATNVRLVALLPAEMEAGTSEAPVKHVVDGQRVLWDPLPSLAPKAEATYTLKAKANQPGDIRLRVQIVTDEIRTPITKEESTRVYADE